MNPDVEFDAVVFEWRGPSPYHFVSIDDDLADWIRVQAGSVSYGWGMVPVTCAVGTTTFTTSLWPKGDSYYLPLKDAVRRDEQISLGDHVTVRLAIRSRRSSLPEVGR